MLVVHNILHNDLKLVNGMDSQMHKIKANVTTVACPDTKTNHFFIGSLKDKDNQNGDNV